MVKSTLKLVKSTLKLVKSTLKLVKSTLKLVKSTLKLEKSTFNFEKSFYCTYGAACWLCLVYIDYRPTQCMLSIHGVYSGCVGLYIVYVEHTWCTRVANT